MADMAEWYRKGLLFYGPYRAYFGRSKQPLSEYVPKASYSGDRLAAGAPERKEQRIEIHPVKNIETKTENAKIEPSQKIETTKENATSQKTESKIEPSNEKLGSPGIYQNEIKAERTDIMTRKRPVNYYDRAETGW